jgi:hypothetical protein
MDELFGYIKDVLPALHMVLLFYHLNCSLNFREDLADLDCPLEMNISCAADLIVHESANILT